MEPEIIKKSGKYYYEGELSAGKLLSKEPLEKSNEIVVNKFDAVILGDRTFLLNPSTEEFMSLQFRNGNYEYIYKSGENCIVRDEDGNEILPKFWIEKGLQVVTSEGIGIVETFTDNVALVKSQTGLKNYYIKGLKPVEDKTDFQRYRTAWTKYNDLLPIIKEEIKSDKTRLIKGAFDEAFKNLDAQMPKKVETPETPKMEIPKVETPSVEPIKEKKQGVMGRIKNFFSKKTPTPTPTPDPQINVNHNIATPPDVSSVKPNTSNPAHLDKQYVHTDKSNLEGIANHAITHIDLNPNSQNDTDKYLYHYEVGSHRDPIVTNKYLDEKGFSADHYGNNIKEPGLTKNGVYVPGERVIDKATGEEHEVVSHIDRNPMTHVINTKNILVRGSDGNIKTLDKDNIQLSSADRTSHSIVNTESGNKHLHDIKEGDVINHEDNKHSVLFSDPEKGLGTINQSTGQMHFTSARDYHKPYLGEAKPIVKEGMTVQIGKSKYKVEHVGGEDKGHSILSKTDKLGNKEYFEHPTEKLHSKILKPADLQDYKGNRFDPKQPETPEGAEGVDSAKEVFKQRTTHPDLKEDDINHLKDNVGMTTEEINNTSPEDMQKLISDKPAPSSNPIPETADPEQVAEQKRLQQETEKKEKHTKNVEHLDSVFGEHNKTEHSDGSVTHRLGVGDLGLKTTPEGKKEVVNPEVQLTKAKGLIVTDIDPVRKIVTTRKKGDVKGKKIEYSFDEFKTEVRENEKHEPSTQVDIKNKQIKHKDEFQQKVIQSTSKHLSEKGIKPTQENIDKELNTSNSELRAEVEKHHKNYERNHNREKSAGSIVDHPEYDKLDINKNLKEITDLEGNVKRTRDSKRGDLKDQLVEDLVDYHKKENTPYSRDHNYDADTGIKEDMDKHRKLGGKDEDIHSEVESRLGQVAEQENKNKELKDKRQKEQEILKAGEKEAEESNKKMKQLPKEEYNEQHHKNKPNILNESLSEKAGLKSVRDKVDFEQSPNYEDTHVDYHIVPLSKVSTSHTLSDQAMQRHGKDIDINTLSKLPFVKNPAYPREGQGRTEYDDKGQKGQGKMQQTIERSNNIRPHLMLKRTGRGDAGSGVPMVDNQINAFTNNRHIYLQGAPQEEKQKYVNHLKDNLEDFYGNEHPEKIQALKDHIDKTFADGDLPVLEGVPVNKADNSYYDYMKHDDYGNFAKATNGRSNQEVSTESESKGVQNSLTDEHVEQLSKIFPSGKSILQHLVDPSKGEQALDILQDGAKIISKNKRDSLYKPNSKILSQSGREFIKNAVENSYYSPSSHSLFENNNDLKKKFYDFGSDFNKELRGIKNQSGSAYDLEGDLQNTFKEMHSESDESVGQQKVYNESNVTKGLRYLMDSDDKEETKNALMSYSKLANDLKGGGDMFGTSNYGGDPKGFKEQFFDKYAKLYDQQLQSKIETPVVSPPKGSDPDTDPENPDPVTPNDPVPVPPSGGEKEAHFSKTHNALKQLTPNKEAGLYEKEPNEKMERILNSIPKVLFHGTNNKDIKFDKGTHLYGTKDKSFASTYGENVMPMHLDIKNPLKLKTTSDGKIRDAQNNILKDNESYDYNINYIDEALKQKLKKEGYDGIELGDRESTIAFEPNQLKPITHEIIAKMYHEAKADGSNPELVKAVEDVINKTSPKKDLPIESPQLKEEGKEQKGKKVEKSYPTVMPIFTDPLNSLLKSFNESELPPIEEIAHNYLRNGIKYHGTSNHSITNKILPPQTTGVLSEVGRKKNLNKVFYTDTENSAKIYAGRAKNSYGGTPKVHRVIPMGDLETLNDTKGTEVHHSDYGVVVTPELESRLNQHLNITNPLQKSQRTIPISSVAVMNGNKILMGRRRDTDKWTLPGGHAEGNETPHEAGLRELEEETGIKADKLKPLGSDMVTRENKQLMINAFRYDTDESTTIKDDPDMEVKKWVWISTPISEEILDNLHAKKNVTLHLLGLQK